jgi:hypothetical protein
MQDLKLDKIISPRPDKGPGFTNVKLKPSTKLPEVKKSQKEVANEKKGWKY